MNSIATAHRIRLKMYRSMVRAAKGGLT